MRPLITNGTIVTATGSTLADVLVEDETIAAIGAGLADRGLTAEVGSTNAGFVGDEVTDRFCVIGEAPEILEKLEILADAGVDQFNVYLMNGDQRDQIERIGRDIIPRVRSRTGVSNLD